MLPGSAGSIRSGTIATPFRTKRTARWRSCGGAKPWRLEAWGSFLPAFLWTVPRCPGLLSCCEELEMPFLFHMASEDAEPYYGVVDAPGLPALERVLRDFQGLTVLALSRVVR